MLSIKLNQKLLLFWFASIVLSMVLLGSVFYFMNQSLHEETIHQRINDAFDSLRHRLDDRQQFLLRNTRLFADREDVIASLSMLHNYQDISNYNPLIFDAEKKKLAFELLQQLETENVNLIAAYDGHMRLASFAFVNKQGESVSAYVTYVGEGRPRYMVLDTSTGAYSGRDTLPVWMDTTDVIREEERSAEYLHAHDDVPVMEFHIPVTRELRDGSRVRVGLITATDHLDGEFARDVSSKAGMGFMLSVDRKNWVLGPRDMVPGDFDEVVAAIEPASTDMSQWKELHLNGDHYGVASYINGFGQKLTFAFAGKSEFSSIFLLFEKAMLLVLLVNAFLFLPIGIYFLKRSVLMPVRRLASGVQLLESGEHKPLPVPRASDELAFLTHAFNSMATAIRMREAELEKLSLAVEQSPVSMMITDLKGQIEYVNPAFTEITGYRREEVIGKSSSILKGGETPREVYKQLWDTVRAGRQWRGVFHNKTRSGDFIWESVQIIPIKSPEGKLLKYLSLGEDISGKKNAEAQLRLQAAALQAAADGIMITDTDGNIQWMNPAYLEITGYEGKELLGKNPRILKSGFQDDAFYQHLWETITSGNTWYGEVHNRRKDGRIYLQEESITPVVDETGEVSSFVAVIRDITEQREQEEQLHRGQKMDALGKLTGGIAHDYNNMLGVILGYADMLKINIDEPRLVKYIEEIDNAARRGAKLTGKLLAFSRQQPTEAEPTDINEVLRNNQLMLEKTLTVRINLVLELADKLYPVLLDHSDLEDALLNVSINAMHAMEEGGRLTLKTENVRLSADDAESLGVTPGDYVLMSVTDTGTGMDEITQSRIFEPFFSTKGDKGTGLGLSQVYGFVQRAEGAVSVASTPGEGSCFSFYFPRYRRENIKGEQVDEAGTSIPGGDETILVVDDEPGLLDLAEEILESYGYRVLCAADGKEALGILEKEHVDLLLSDVIMPNVDGYELARQAREHYPSIKIQMNSGYNDEEPQGAIDEDLHRQLIRKPFDFKVLLVRLRELLDGTAQPADEEEVVQADIHTGFEPIKWSDKISTHIPAIDADHRVLLGLANQARQMVVEGGGKDAIEDILRQLQDYISYHFDREEKVMEACGYPYLENHRRVHQMLVKQVALRMTEFECGELSIEKLYAFLSGWLTDHIMDMDKDIEPYARGKEEAIEHALRAPGSGD